ncbi:dehydrogenase/reductase (SDR family) member 1, isoform CRA_c [Rattus norvegicus]|uniref:Dehydrogenase/reductase (SDR family) member 1, isoform CRA_c n=1 Tax=Rattus norvegicus TaxID=10116 RepID=A6KH47_RAT|nr:dehydrogenase/reductase (SDR family) member 1, isoform CRA_c [Rattus norvegicus]
MIMTMKGQVCVVTGASRGIGRGIALQLCQAGATVYITGRHLDTLRATAQEAQSLGGRCVPVVCDSSQESEVKSLFEQVDREQQGRLDVLVNNAYAGVQRPLLMLCVWGTADGTSWQRTYRGCLFPRGAAAYVQCPLWCGQSCVRQTGC